MRAAVCLLSFNIIVIASGHADTLASAASEVPGWQTVAGHPPSEHELAAVLAACEARAKDRKAQEPMEGCLADYGLYRIQ